ncbi:MAG: O-methyltransferase [Clostridia bacterium]|jgi:predicted O-methyltransferase YrrM
MINYEYINEYIRKTIRKNSGILAEMEKYAKENYVPVISPEVVSLIRIICSIKKPKRILEIGTAIGYSALILSESLCANGVIDTIERDESMIVLAKKYIKKANKEKLVNVIAGEADDVLKCLNKGYDIIFMDAAKAQYKEFLKECLRMLNPDGILISDNVLYKGMVANEELVTNKKKTIAYKMRSYLEELCRNKELETTILPVGDGVTISHKTVGDDIIIGNKKGVINEQG